MSTCCPVTVDWRKSRIKPVIARIVLGQRICTQQQRQKEAIFQELERESSLKGISIELSREAGKFTQDVEVPEEYRRHVNIFDPVECHETMVCGLTQLESS